MDLIDDLKSIIVNQENYINKLENENSFLQRIVDRVKMKNYYRAEVEREFKDKV